MTEDSGEKNIFNEDDDKSTTLQRSIVKEEDISHTDQEELKAIAGRLFKKMVRKDETNIFNIIILSLATIEEFVRRGHQLTSSEKLRLALRFIPLLCEILIDKDIISRQMASDIEAIVTNGLILGFIETAIKVSHLHDLFDGNNGKSCWNRCCH